MRKVLWGLLISILVVACRGSGVHQPQSISTPDGVIPPTGVGDRREILDLRTFVSEVSAPVVAVAFSENSDELFVVYGGEDGALQKWRTMSSTLLSTMDVGPIGIAALSSDGQTSLLAVGAGTNQLSAKREHPVGLRGAHLWDINSGKRVLETVPDDMYFGLLAVDVSLTPDGRLLAVATSGGIDVWDTNTRQAVLLLAVDTGIKEDYSRTLITSIAIDPTGRWIAYADDSGTIEVEDRELKRTVHSIDIPGDGIPLALDFEPSGSWLAIITTESLVKWNLNVQPAKVVLATFRNIEFADLAFSRDGSMLAVGTSHGWHVWSVLDQKILVEHDQPTHAVAFSPDGRLFAWGDANGVVHLWGISDP